MLVQPEHRLALHRFVARASDVDSTEIHLDRILADRQLDRAPAQQMERTGVRSARVRSVAGERGREAAAVPIDHQSSHWRGLAPVIDCQQQHEVAGSERPRRPVQERRAGAECKVPSIGRLERELVEPPERHLRCLGRDGDIVIGAGMLRAIGRGSVVADDRESVALGLADALPGGLGNVLEVKDRIVFNPYPHASMAIWFMTQLKRWGMVKGDINYAQIAEQVMMLTEAKARLAELGVTPDLNRKEVIMGKAFDPSKPEEYIQSFKIRRV